MRVGSAFLGLAIAGLIASGAAAQTAGVPSQVNTSGATVTVASCGTGPTVAAGSDRSSGTITEGATATACAITFPYAYASTPICLVANPAGGALEPAWSESTTGIAVTNAATSVAIVIKYHCDVHGS